MSTLQIAYTVHGHMTFAHRKLERRILAGVLRLGDRSDASAVATSPGPLQHEIRDAIASPAQSRLVRTDESDGALVRQVTHEEAEAICEIRAALDDLVGRLAAKRAGEAEITELRILAREMKVAGRGRDTKAWKALNLEFHDRLARITHNATLLAIYRCLVNELRLYERDAPAPGGDALCSSSREHAAIVEAIALGKGGRAGALLRDHAMQDHARLRAARERD